MAEELTEQQKHCDHFTVRRIMDWHECLGCGLEFVAKTLTLTEEQKNCDHFTVRRILDSWVCLNPKCGLEFLPKRLLKKGK